MPTKRFDRAEPPRGRRLTYRQDIVAVRCLKAVLIALLYFVFFLPAKQPAVTPPGVAHHLLTMATSETTDEVNHDR